MGAMSSGRGRPTGIAILLLVLGVVLFAAGVALYLGGAPVFSGKFSYVAPYRNPDSTSGATLAILGGACIIFSVNMLIAKPDR
jgi:hypothetical protein